MATWLEHREHGTYPNGKGYDDQPVRLLEDWATLDQRYGDIYNKTAAAKDNETDWIPETLVDLPDETDPPPEPSHSLGLLERLKAQT